MYNDRTDYSRQVLVPQIFIIIFLIISGAFLEEGLSYQAQKLLILAVLLGCLLVSRIYIKTSGYLQIMTALLLLIAVTVCFAAAWQLHPLYSVFIPLSFLMLPVFALAGRDIYSRQTRSEGLLQAVFNKPIIEKKGHFDEGGYKNAGAWFSPVCAKSLRQANMLPVALLVVVSFVAGFLAFASDFQSSKFNLLLPFASLVCFYAVYKKIRPDWLLAWATASVLLSMLWVLLLTLEPGGGVILASGFFLIACLVTISFLSLDLHRSILLWGAALFCILLFRAFGAESSEMLTGALVLVSFTAAFLSLRSYLHRFSTISSQVLFKLLGAKVSFFEGLSLLVWVLAKGAGSDRAFLVYGDTTVKVLEHESIVEVGSHIKLARRNRGKKLKSGSFISSTDFVESFSSLGIEWVTPLPLWFFYLRIEGDEDSNSLPVSIFIPAGLQFVFANIFCKGALQAMTGNVACFAAYQNLKDVSHSDDRPQSLESDTERLNHLVNNKVQEVLNNMDQSRDDRVVDSRPLALDGWMLFVDDNDEIIKFYSRLAVALEISYRSCSSVMAANDLIASMGKPEIVITDIHMGEENGLDLVRSLRSSYPDLPILVVSGSLGAEEQQMIKDFENVRYLMKPVGRRKFFEEVSTMIRG